MPETKADFPSSPSFNPLVSVVVTTKNEEKNIVACLESIRQQSYPSQQIETIVVDNFSTDKTCELARRYTDKVFLFGPERSAQRNLGMIEKAQGQYVMFVDADMILSPRLVERCVEWLQRGDCIALHIPEIVLGRSYWSSVRRFERRFYDGTVIDGARFFLKEVFQKAGGFDEHFSGPEDWDLDKKIKQFGTIALLKTPVAVLARTEHKELDSFLRQRGTAREQFGEVIFHNESNFNVWRYLIKKNYYTLGFDSYVLKWGKDDPDIRRQFGLLYRYIFVFVEGGKWNHLLRHPLYAVGMFFLRFAVGCVYVTRRLRQKI